MTAAVGKAEDPREGSTSSIEDSPEPGQAETYTQENPQQQKRKGGRKPAQAAFRERRTEYIKQLESTIKHHEETLQNLQNSHRNAADECLMLRYKNSLLERVLLEKGIDVQAELRAKTGSPSLGPTRPAASAHTSPNQPPLQQRAILNRQQQRRSLQGPPKADGTNGLPMIQPDGPIQRSPLSQPTPGSHLSSPAQSATRSPNFMPQEQEYDEQADNYDHEEPSDHSAGPGPFPHPNFPPANSMPPPMPPAQNPPFASPATLAPNDGGQPFNNMNHLFDPYDPMLDADPFGLSASMHFPTMYESR
ncbi:hypothetical protein SLS59_008379 [Nothophoma quercina]|uniref:MEAB protein n=1 Tax=Nothophoma quercina TaxID=749835 RepID=A0ABR3QTF4_9PLEO